MLDSLTLLEELGINEANLVTVRENAFVKLNLSHLSLRHNHLTQIPDAVSKLPFLRELDLFENPIEVVSDQEALVFQSNLKLLRKLVMNSESALGRRCCCSESTARWPSHVAS